VQNGPEELFAYFAFLRYAPFDSLAAFHALMKEEAVLGEGTLAVTRLRNILRPVMLRRTKESAIDGAPILALPPRWRPCLLHACSACDRACIHDTVIIFFA
jgi:SNF2 family DNA or RNA helicase